MQRFAGDKAVILMASSTGTPAGRGSGVGSFGYFNVTCNRLLYQVIEVFTKRVVHLLLHTLFTEKKNTLVTQFCE